MASPSSRGSSRSGSSSRGGSPGGAGSTNTAATIVAVAVVGLIVGGVVLMSGKKKELPKPTVPTALPTTAPKSTPVASAPPAKPYPPMPQEKFAEATKLVESFEADAKKADGIYAESLKAKADGDDVKWQAKFAEFDGLLQGIKSKWNEFIDSLPSNNDYNIEEVAKYYFPKESGREAQLTKKLAASKTDQR